MAKKAPGKSHREGITLVELMDMFPTEEAATAWFEDVFWGCESRMAVMSAAWFVEFRQRLPWLLHVD